MRVLRKKLTIDTVQTRPIGYLAPSQFYFSLKTYFRPMLIKKLAFSGPTSVTLWNWISHTSVAIYWTVFFL